MTSRRRILLYAGIIAACIVATISVLAMLPPRPGVTKANFDRVEKGMTLTEVEAILGKASLSRLQSGSVTTRWINDEFDRTQVWVVFINGLSHDTLWAGFEPTETIPEKLRRWLGPLRSE